MIMVKKTISNIVKPLNYIFNMSLKSGIFPDDMKIAKIIPLFKAGGKKEFSNYRPVSILPQFSKNLEKLFYKRLLAFLKSNEIIYKGQYGFRENHSTSLAHMDKGLSTVGVFIDIKKAFDTINHSILIKKLYKYGIRGIALKWIENY